ncbi:UNVERIFIED_CONTAM: hypothetical protein O8I53_06045 [Campylobacter lari]
MQYFTEKEKEILKDIPYEPLLNAYVIFVFLTVFNLIAIIINVILRFLLKKPLEEGKKLVWLKKLCGGTIASASAIPAAVFTANFGGFANVQNNLFNNMNNSLINKLSFNKAAPTAEYLQLIFELIKQIDKNNENSKENPTQEKEPNLVYEFIEYINQIGRLENYAVEINHRLMPLNSVLSEITSPNTFNEKLFYFFNLETINPVTNQPIFKNFEDLDNINDIFKKFTQNDTGLKFMELVFKKISENYRGKLKSNYFEIKQKLEKILKFNNKLFNQFSINLNNNFIQISHSKYKEKVVEIISNLIFSCIDDELENVQIPADSNEMTTAKQKIKHFILTIIKQAIVSEK